MDSQRRALFNAAFTQARYQKLLALLEKRVGPVPFRVAEAPLFLTSAVRDDLVCNALEIAQQLSTPERVEALKKAIPARYDVPGMDVLPNTVQVDFALVHAPNGAVEGRLIELQGFPSLYCLMPMMAECWREVMADIPGLGLRWTAWVGDDDHARDVLGRTLLAGNDPAEVVLMDIEPEKQKTSPDFEATRQMFGIEAVCVTKVKVEGRKLFREKDGWRIPIRRIYNRMVFDELEAKKVPVPFDWRDPPDVTWCSHPNWYWAWSKYCLPFLKHRSVPETRFLSEIDRLPDDLQNYVLKPLFSFAGGGVVIDVTREAVERIPAADRPFWVLMRKIQYAPVLAMPDGNGVKAEVRVMLARPPTQRDFVPLLCLVRLSRGKMIGVDFNKDLTWTGGSVGIWPR